MIAPALATAPRTRIAFTPTGRTHRPRPIGHKDQPGRGDPANSTHSSVARQPRDTDANQSLSIPAASEDRPCATPFTRPTLPATPPPATWRAHPSRKDMQGPLLEIGQSWPRAANRGHRDRPFLRAPPPQPCRAMPCPRRPHNCSSSRNKPKASGSKTNPITRGTRTNPLLPSYRVLARGSRPPTHGVAQALSLPSRHPSRLRSSRRRPGALRPRCLATPRRLEPNEPNGAVAKTNPTMRGATTNPIRLGHNKANPQWQRRTQSGAGPATNHGSRITNHATKPHPNPRRHHARSRNPTATGDLYSMEIGRDRSRQGGRSGRYQTPRSAADKPRSLSLLSGG